MIIFLDFDGVISSPRAFNARPDMEDFYKRWLDPIACRMVRNLCVNYGAQIVVSSTWRNFGRDHLNQSLEDHGLIEFFHEDWRTVNIVPRNRDSRYDRPDEIEDWLGRNGRPEYIILDDDSFYWTEEQKPWVVKTCTYNGMGLFEYEKAQELLQFIKEGGVI